MFHNVYRNKKILITGNTGFKGSWLTIWLLKLGAHVYGLSKDIPTKPSMFEEAGLEKRIEHRTQDIRDLVQLKESIDDIRPDFIFHLAAQPLVSVSYTEPSETISTNVMGTANILETLRSVNHECSGIIITSDKCYDNVEWAWGYRETDKLGGKDIYSGSKGAAELVIRSYYHSFFKKADSNVKIVTARAGNVIGGGDWAKDRIVPDCIRSWSNNEIVKIRSPNATRPWQHVLEPLSGYLALGQQIYECDDLNGESFNFGPLSQYSQSVKTLIEDLSEKWHGVGQERKAYGVAGKDNVTFHEAGLLKLNCDKAILVLRWVPALDYEKVIEFTGNWYLKFYKEKKNIFDLTLSQIDEYERIASDKAIQWTSQ